MPYTENDILLQARYRAACRAKRRAIKEHILSGRWDDKSSVIRAKRQVEREIALAAAEGIKPLADDEDEPCFAALIERAKARATELAGTPDGHLISELVAAYEHADTMADMIYWNASDNHELPHDV